MTRTIPSAINLGVMSVACATVRESIAEKHHTVRMLMLDHISVTARPSLIPSLCTTFTRAGIEWRCCPHAVCMTRPCKEPRHSGQAEP